MKTTDLLRLASVSLLIRTLNVVLLFTITIVLSRTLGPEQYGIYIFAVTLVNFLTIPIQTGIPTLLVREISVCKLTKKWGTINGLVRFADTVVVVYSIGVTALLGFVLLSASWIFPVAHVPTIMAALLYCPVIVFAISKGAIIRGLGYVIDGQIPEMLLRPAIALLLIFVLGNLADITPYRVIWLQVIAASLALMYGLYRLSHYRPIHHRKQPAEYNSRRWISSATIFAVLAGMQIVTTQTDVLVIGALLTARDVGIYQIAVQGAMLVAFMLAAVNMVIAPRIAKIHENRDHQALQNIATWGARVATLSALPIAALLIIAGDILITFIFGIEYKDAALPMSILCVGQTINALMGSVGLLLTMTGHERDAVAGIVIAAIVNLVLNVLLIPIYGINGAAFATTASLVIWNLILAVRVWKKLGISSTIILAS